ncbi:ABC transporter substrate-binding protein [Cutibacterium avidum]|uniref:ABC transporter substrate-binding protein n=1 Tax=Cutibacterium avidum TaxID=33010 RepID=UPI00083E8E58|nr:substrate-binding domain-containing protein [Cutibacterium avidum]AOG27593.1 ABC transporter substrate-binding protein [Cutibacterium avidum]
MIFSRRHFLSASAGLATAAVLTGCGSNTGSVSTGSKSSAASGGSGKIVQWYHEYGEKGVQQAVNRYAKDYKDATVTVKWNPGTDYMKLLSTTLLSGSGIPDVFESEYGATLDMIQKGQVVDLTDTIGDAKSKFSKPVLDRMTLDGKIYAIPQVVDMQLLYYRKSALEKAKLSAPTTFEQLVETAKAVKTKEMGGFFAGNDGGVGVLGNLLIWASGFDQLNDAHTDVAFMEQAFFDAVAAYRDFYKSGALLTAASKDWFDASPFTNGETAMQWGGLWSLGDISKKWKDDFGVIPFPAIGKSGKQAVPFGAYGSCVAAKGASNDVEAAKKYAKWLWVDQTDKQVDFANSYGTHIPSQPDLTDKCSQINNGAGKAAAEMVDKHGKAASLFWTSKISDAYSAALTNVVKKGADPKSAFAGVQSTAKAELKRVNK